VIAETNTKQRRIWRQPDPSCYNKLPQRSNSQKCFHCPTGWTAVMW